MKEKKIISECIYSSFFARTRKKQRSVKVTSRLPLNTIEFVELKKITKQTLTW